MADCAFGAGNHIVTGRWPKFHDAQILKEAIRASISTSPEAFLTTIEDVNRRTSEYWAKEILSSTWAVIQRGDEVVGIAVARWPNLEIDRDIDRARACFIESVWIAPELRGNHLGERLVRFLFEMERAKNSGVRRFLLWVLDRNSQAIRLYERMGFRYVERQHLPDWSGRTELRYEYRLEPDSAEMKAAAVARQDDLREYGVIYRVLGEGETT
jgi:ribosomal protein S18 acetylase RimI-like enzyme